MLGSRPRIVSGAWLGAIWAGVILITGVLHSEMGSAITRASVGDVITAKKCHQDQALSTIPKGSVLLGEDGAGVPGEKQMVPAFAIDSHEVTNRQFARFVAATRYVTDAERTGGGAVFNQPERISSYDPAQWWRFSKGANWRHPEGPASSIEGRMDYPVVQVTFADASAYARWAGRTLPTEAQWERAARADQRSGRPRSSWAFAEAGRPLANVWEGVFPIIDTGEDGHKGLAPVGCFDANAFGVHDMIGNVWEWTTKSGDGPGSRIVKGGSYLCSENYCANFRPAGFQAQEADLSTSHIGFRTVVPEG